jgi:hypothetical protein
VDLTFGISREELQAMIQASCHCGAIRIEISRLPSSLTQCTCSIYRRSVSQYRPAHVNLGFSHRLSLERQNIEFYHCKECGCVTHYESKRRRPIVELRLVRECSLRAMSLGSESEPSTEGDTWKYLDCARQVGRRGNRSGSPL